MAKLVLKSIAFILLLCGCYLGMVLTFSYIPKRYHYQPGSTPATLFVLKEHQYYDLVFLGASHAHSLLKHGNYRLVEDTLNRTIANLSHGAGAGIVPMGIMSDYFFTIGNSCGRAIYFIDSQSFFMRELNENHGFLEDEPIDLTLARLAYKWGIDNNSMATYFQSKIRPTWLLSKPKALTRVLDSVTQIDQHKLNLRRENMFPDSLEEDMANHYVNRLNDLITLLKQNHCEVVFIVPPTLLGVLPGDAFLLALLEKKRKEEGIIYLDLSQAILDPALYEDLDHLNTKGTLVLMEKYIKPLTDTLKMGGVAVE